MEKISNITNSLFAIAHSGIRVNVDYIEKICKECYEGQESFSKEMRNEIGLEYVIVFINLIIRVAYDILDDGKAYKLLAELEKVLWEHISGTVGKMNAEDSIILKKEFEIYFFSQSNQYGEYKLFSTKDNSRKDTLFWEFGKNISKISGHPHDARIVIAGSSGALAFAEERKEIEKIITQIL